MEGIGPSSADVARAAQSSAKDDYEGFKNKRINKEQTSQFTEDLGADDRDKDKDAGKPAAKAAAPAAAAAPKDTYVPTPPAPPANPFVAAQ